jgi:hypothetical protein
MLKNAPFRQAPGAETGIKSIQLLMISKEGNEVHKVNLAFLLEVECGTV